MGFLSEGAGRRFISGAIRGFGEGWKYQIMEQARVRAAENAARIQHKYASLRDTAKRAHEKEILGEEAQLKRDLASREAQLKRDIASREAQLKRDLAGEEAQLKRDIAKTELESKRETAEAKAIAEKEQALRKWRPYEVWSDEENRYVKKRVQVDGQGKITNILGEGPPPGPRAPFNVPPPDEPPGVVKPPGEQADPGQDSSEKDPHYSRIPTMPEEDDTTRASSGKTSAEALQSFKGSLLDEEQETSDAVSQEEQERRKAFMKAFRTEWKRQNKRPNPSTESKRYEEWNQKRMEAEKKAKELLSDPELTDEQIQKELLSPDKEQERPDLNKEPEAFLKWFKKQEKPHPNKDPNGFRKWNEDMLIAEELQKAEDKPAEDSPVIPVVPKQHAKEPPSGPPQGAVFKQEDASLQGDPVPVTSDDWRAVSKLLTEAERKMEPLRADALAIVSKILTEASRRREPLTEKASETLDRFIANIERHREPLAEKVSEILSEIRDNVRSHRESTVTELSNLMTSVKNHRESFNLLDRIQRHRESLSDEASKTLSRLLTRFEGHREATRDEAIKTLPRLLDRVKRKKESLSEETWAAIASYLEEIKGF